MSRSKFAHGITVSKARNPTNTRWSARDTKHFSMCRLRRSRTKGVHHGCGLHLAAPVTRALDGLRKRLAAKVHHATLRIRVMTPWLETAIQKRRPSGVSHEPKGISFRILADSEVVSGMDYGAVKLDNSLKSVRHVIHNEIWQRECVARPGPAFVDTYLGCIGTSLPTLSFATFASIELNVQHTLPESEGALRVVGWKLDKGDGRANHAPHNSGA